MNRWYDKYPTIKETITLLQDLDDDSQNEIAKRIIDVSSSLKLIYKEEPLPNLSLGKDRVLGLYLGAKKRRWYDEINCNTKLAYALKSISTLPEEDFIAIMDSINQFIK